MNKVKYALLFFLIIFYFYTSVKYIRISSPTYDETVHLASGYSYYYTSKYQINIYDHPPLAEMIAAFPLIFYRLKSFMGHIYYKKLMPYSYADVFIYKNNVDAEKIVNTSRIFLLFLWFLLFSISFYYISVIFNDKKMFLVLLLLFIFEPNLKAHLPLITTDIAPTFFYFAVFTAGELFFRFYSRRKYFIFIISLLSSFAMASKFSMFILPPLFVFYFILRNIFEPRFKYREIVKLTFMYLIFSLLGVYIIYKGNLSLYFDGLKATMERLSNGRSSYIMGHYSTEGVWWYFPVAFILKSSLVYLILYAGGIYIFLKEKKYRENIFLMIPFVFYLTATFFSKVQIGIRHMLPVVPYLLVFASFFAVKVYEMFKEKSYYILAILFTIVLYSHIRVHPHYLSYFNELIDPQYAYRYLADSNLDWGQDLKGLSDYLKSIDNAPVVLSYFGSANPYYYKIKFIPLMFVKSYKLDYTDIPDLCKFKRVLVAVSATNLVSVYYTDKNTFKFLYDTEPLKNVGNSIFLYDLTEKKEKLKELKRLFKINGMLKEYKCIDKFIRQGS